jgi:HAD superfamily hydrolase (TIGR01490 family)
MEDSHLVDLETGTLAADITDERPRLALFDLDHTLLPIDSDYAWGTFLVAKGVVDGKWYERRNAEFYEAYKAGTLDITEFLEFALAPLAAHDRATLDVWHREYMRDVIEPHVRESALALVARHLDAGDVCAVVTATNAYVTAPIARRFGVPHLIATVPAQTDGRFDGHVRGAPCFREGKVSRATDWLESMGASWDAFASSTFYSDSRNDIALLEHVTDPVATNPDDTLRAHALARGWRHLELFE